MSRARKASDDFHACLNESGSLSLCVTAFRAQIGDHKSDVSLQNAWQRENVILSD